MPRPERDDNAREKRDKAGNGREMGKKKVGLSDKKASGRQNTT